MPSLRILDIAHDWITQVVQAGDLVIDATTGNGHDTLFLSSLVGDEGRVYGFDIQGYAIEKTTQLLQKAGGEAGKDYLSRVSLQASCHSELGTYCSAEVSAIMFNLGYLPKGDKTIITKEETTLKALEASLTLLRVGGIMTVMCYPGHEGGEDEASQVDKWSGQLPTSHYQVLRLQPHNAKSVSPYLLALKKVR